jgi:hypothetical protein
MPRNALLVEITAEDEAYAQSQNQWACLIVCAIQRKYPTALRVKANEKEIAFSLPEDDTRYIFETPAEVREHVIKPFDLGEPIEEEYKTFTISHAIDARPITHDSSKRVTERNRRRRTSPRTQNPNVRTYGRFLTAKAEEEGPSS